MLAKRWHTISARRRETSSRLAACVALVGLLGLAVGCSGDKEPEPGARATPKPLVPATVDSAAADTAAVADPAAADTVAIRHEPQPAAGAATLKATEGETETAAGPAGAAKLRGTSPSGTTRPGNGDFSLQLGSFSDEANARRQVERIAELGYQTTVEVAALGGRTYHRVVLRGLADRDEAERLGEHIRSALGVTYLIRQK